MGAAVKGAMITNSQTRILDSEMDSKAKYFIYVLAVLSTVGGFLFGYDTGVVSGAVLLITRKFRLSSVWHEAIVSGAVGAALVFALIGGWMAGRFGRKPTILTASAMFTSGAVLMAVANSEYVLLVGRCIVGAGIGLASMSIPVYIAECAPSDKRGLLVTLFQVLITFGLFASCVVCALLANVTEGWRYMLGLAAVPAGIQFVGFLFMPESPRWLISNKRYDRASQVLFSIHGVREVVEKEMSSIKTVCEEEELQAQERKKAGIGGFLPVSILKSASARRALIIGCLTMVFQQLSGINTVMYYSASIIRMSGVDDDSTAIWYAAAVSAVNFVFSFAGMYLVERIGRRTLMLASLLGVALSLILLGAGFYLTQRDYPDITVGSNDPLCGGFKSCGECISNHACGFCFSTNSTNSTNSTSFHPVEASCWPLNDENLPLAGPCNTTGRTAVFNWAPDWCPSKYYWVPIIAMCLYLVMFSPGMGPMPWTINSEIHPMWARNFSTSITTCTNWAMNLIVSMSFLSLIDAMGQTGTFYLYACIAIFGFIVLWLFLPETRGLSLEEVHQLFHKSWFIFRQKRQPGTNQTDTNSEVNSRKSWTFDLNSTHM